MYTLSQRTLDFHFGHWPLTPNGRVSPLLVLFSVMKKKRGVGDDVTSVMIIRVTLPLLFGKSPALETSCDLEASSSGAVGLVHNGVAPQQTHC